MAVFVISNVALQPGTALAATGSPAPTAPAMATPPNQTDHVVIGSAAEQVIDGFGFSEAYMAYDLQTLPAATYQRVMQLLFDRAKGAGMDIVRFGLPYPAGTLADQLELGETAKKYGVHTFYADAVTAPATMKTNRSLSGGYLCGTVGERCARGDFRTAYASYLASQAQAFDSAGLPVQEVGFTNEPEIARSYPSMLMDPEQVADFVPYLGRALRARHLSTKISCCDSIGWNTAPAYVEAVLRSPATARFIGLITAHCYSAGPDAVLTDARPVWETEYSDFQPWDTAWNDGTGASGLSWADIIYGALTRGDVNAFMYWWGAFTSGMFGADNEGLIRVKQHSRAYQVSSRLWAFAGFSRYIRPGAVRVATSSSDATIDAVAFRQGSDEVLIVINNGAGARTIVVDAGTPISTGRAQPFLTDAHHHASPLASQPIVGGRLQSTVPAGALESFVLVPGRHR